MRLRWLTRGGRAQAEHSTGAMHGSCAARFPVSLEHPLHLPRSQNEWRHRATFRRNPPESVMGESSWDLHRGEKCADLFCPFPGEGMRRPIHSDMFYE